MVRLAEQLEPEGGDLRQNPPLVGDGRRQHPIEGADPVGAHQQEAVAEIINIATFPRRTASPGKDVSRTTVIALSKWLADSGPRRIYSVGDELTSGSGQLVRAGRLG